MNARAFDAPFDPSGDPAGRELILTRVFDAPRALVFHAWTDPRHVARWWGPNGFTNTVHEMDVRPGGVWRYMMHGPDGVDYPNRVVYIEVAEPERLVYWHDDDGAGGQKPFHVTVTFDEADGKTTLTLRTLLVSVEERERLAGFGAIEGGRQTLERFAVHLKTM